MRGAGHRTLLATVAGGYAFLIAASQCLAQPATAFPLPRTTFGTIGLIEMPSARMAPDGQISVSASILKNTQRYNFGFQALPWLEVSFRYTGLQHFDTLYSTYYDRSYGIKIRLFEEGEYRPAIALGIRDLIGTGIYSGEYIAATKRVFDNFDATIGFGWGRLGTANTLSNPLGYLIHSFKTRPPIKGTGQADFGQLFHGSRIGVFGGVVWRTPIKNLSLIAEYSGDRYPLETAAGTFRPRTQINFGANYQIFDSLQVGVDWLYGESVGIHLSVNMDPTQPIFPDHIAPEPIRPAYRAPKQQLLALETMLQEQQRQAALVRQRLLAQTSPRARSVAIDRFADTVIDRSNNVRSVAFRGTTFLVSTGRAEATSEACQAYARLASAYVGDVQTVVLSSASQDKVSCRAAQTPRPPLWQTDPTQDTSQSAIPAVASFVDDDGSTAADRTAPARDNAAIEAMIRHDAAGQSIDIRAVSLSTSEATLYYHNGRYESEAAAVGRLVRVLLKDAPPDVEIFRLIAVNHDIPVQEFRILRAPIERAIAQDGGPTEIEQAVSMQRPKMDTETLDDATANAYPKFGWAAFPILRESFFDPNNPVRVALLAGLSGSVDLMPGLSIGAQVEGNIWNDFEDGRLSNSKLHHVRSDFVEYYRHGVNGVEHLSASYRFRLAPSVFGIVKAGYLESMFGGFGGEVLWQPEGSRLALGADLYEVWQRRFDRLFGFLPYHVLTGHVTIYYSSPWYGLNFRVHAGRYLAGDRGITFEMTRRFSTGVEIGAFATFTNVPFNTFGEGSFDKGIVIRIPLDWALPVSTQTQFNVDLRPLTRDGGQRLVGDTTLYDANQNIGYNDMNSHWDEIARP